MRGRGSVDACGAPREDDPRYPPALQASQGGVVRQQLRVDAERPDATAYEMRILAAEIEDDDSATEQVGSQLTNPSRWREGECAPISRDPWGETRPKLATCQRSRMLFAPP